jgi:hypothetical protein
MNAVEALTAAQVAERCGYLDDKGAPKGRTIRQLFRDGRFPAPIDPELPVRLWRWSSIAVGAYLAGSDWRAAS